MTAVHCAGCGHVIAATEDWCSSPTRHHFHVRCVPGLLLVAVKKQSTTISSQPKGSSSWHR